MTTSDKLFDISIRISKAKCKDIESLWELFFVTYLKSEGFCQKSISKLFSWGELGYNWIDLHLPNTEYNGGTKHELLADFKGEVIYISDKCSLDRLFRTHWLYNQAFLVEKMKRVEVVKTDKTDEVKPKRYYVQIDINGSVFVHKYKMDKSVYSTTHMIHAIPTKRNDTTKQGVFVGAICVTIKDEYLEVTKVFPREMAHLIKS